MEGPCTDETSIVDIGASAAESHFVCIGDLKPESEERLI